MAIFLSKLGSDKPRKWEKNFHPKFRSFQTRARKFQKKNSKKIQKKKKTSFRHYFLAKGEEIGQERETKILVTNSVHTRHGQENSEKIAKKLKKLKNLFPTLFLAKTGWDRPGKREKKFTPEFCLYSTQARKFRKKWQKIWKK